MKDVNKKRDIEPQFAVGARGPRAIIELKKQAERTIYKTKSLKQCKMDKATFKKSSDAMLTEMTRYIKTQIKGKKNIAMLLSLGADSRSVFAVLMSLGVKPTCIVAGCRIKIQQKMCRMYNLPMLNLDVNKETVWYGFSFNEFVRDNLKVLSEYDLILNGFGSNGVYDGFKPDYDNDSLPFSYKAIKEVLPALCVPYTESKMPEIAKKYGYFDRYRTINYMVKKIDKRLCWLRVSQGLPLCFPTILHYLSRPIILREIIRWKLKKQNCWDKTIPWDTVIKNE